MSDQSERCILCGGLWRPESCGIRSGQVTDRSRPDWAIDCVLVLCGRATGPSDHRVTGASELRRHFQLSIVVGIVGFSGEPEVV